MAVGGAIVGSSSSSVGSWANKNKDKKPVNIPGQGYSFTSGGVGYEVSPGGTVKIIKPSGGGSKNKNKEVVQTALTTSGMTTPVTQMQQLTQQQKLERQGISVSSLRAGLEKPNPTETGKIFLKDVAVRTGEASTKIVGAITPNFKGDYSTTSSEEAYRRSQIDLANAKQTTITTSQTPVTREFLEKNKFYEVSAEKRIQEEIFSTELKTDLTSKEEVEKANLDLSKYTKDIWKETNIKVAKRDAPAQFFESATIGLGISTLTAIAPPLGGIATGLFLTSTASQLSKPETRIYIKENPEAFAITTGSGIAGGVTGAGLGSYTIGKIKFNAQLKAFERAVNENPVSVFGTGYKDITGTEVKYFKGNLPFKNDIIEFQTKSYTKGDITVGQTSLLGSKNYITFVSKSWKTPYSTRVTSNRSLWCNSFLL